MTAPRQRMIATEEHFATNEYFAALRELQIAAGEESDQAFMLGVTKSHTLVARFADIDARLREMDSALIDHAVLSLNPPGVQIFADPDEASALVGRMNDTLAKLVGEHPERLSGLGSIAPQDPATAAQEISRIMGPLGLGGVLISSHTHGHYLDEPEYEPILAAFEQEDAAVYLHPRVPSPAMLQPYRPYGMIGALWGFQAEAGTHAIRLIMSGALDRHPKLKIVLGHLGEALPFWLWRLDNIYAKTLGWAGDALGMVKLDLKPSEYLRRNFLFTTSGMFDPAIIEFSAKTLGADRIMFAVDHPYEDGRVAVEALAAASLTDEQRALITHRNAESIFRVGRAADR
jgi:predicted TIM-barrel fold metal-dependent hydrolase